VAFSGFLVLLRNYYFRCDYQLSTPRFLHVLTSDIVAKLCY